jgi:hypothetical protein
VFRGNRFEGRHEGHPESAGGAFGKAPRPIAFDDGPGPRFDPTNPETFGAFIEAHREWVLRLMERQFGQRPELGR